MKHTYRKTCLTLQKMDNIMEWQNHAGASLNSYSTNTKEFVG